MLRRIILKTKVFKLSFTHFVRNLNPAVNWRGIYWINAILKGSYEFLFYAVILLGVLQLVAHIYKNVQFAKSILFLLSFFGLLHLSAGNIMVDGDVLYNYWIIPEYFKFDNFVHSIGGMISGFLAYNFISGHLKDSYAYSFSALFFIIITLASGMGAYNEIVELIAVIFFDAGEKVGDYKNNALDLVYNLAGAAVSATVIGLYKGVLKIDID